MRYWLFKTDPDIFSWEDLKKLPDQCSPWEGVRNYQARNFIKSMRVDDQILFYHSLIEPLAIYGTCKVVKEPYPDYFQYNEKSKYFDPGSSAENPRWWMVDVKADLDFNPPITRDEIKNTKGLADMVLLQKGSRLSIQPVTEQEWLIINSLRNQK